MNLDQFGATLLLTVTQMCFMASMIMGNLSGQGMISEWGVVTRLSRLASGAAQVQKDISSNGTLVATHKYSYIQQPVCLTNRPGFFSISCK